MRVILTGMGGLYNRGCEAIVRGTAEILRRVWPEVQVGVAVGYPANAEAARNRLGDPGFDIYALHRWKLPFGLRRVHRTVHGALHWLTGDARIGALPPGHPVENVDLILSVGGDTMIRYVDVAIRLLRHAGYMAHGIDVGIWGMNMEPFPAPARWYSKLPQALAKYQIITVRDEASREFLAGLGVERNVRRMADPAFEMPPEPWDTSGQLPEAGERGIVGLNLSPYLLGGPESPERVRIASETTEALVAAGFGVLLVPHCVPPGCPVADDDLMILQPAYEALARLGPRVAILPPALNAAQIKHAIAQCTLYAGARMHSTIAAWSSGVPVLSLSYSRKSRNLNDEIHGHQRWVLPAEGFDPRRVSDLAVEMSGQTEAIGAEAAAGVARMRAHTTALVEELKATGLPGS